MWDGVQILRKPTAFSPICESETSTIGYGFYSLYWKYWTVLLGGNTCVSVRNTLGLIRVGETVYWGYVSVVLFSANLPGKEKGDDRFLPDTTYFTVHLWILNNLCVTENTLWICFRSVSEKNIIARCRVHNNAAQMRQKTSTSVHMIACGGCYVY